MFDEVFPYIWIHLMDVQKVSKKHTISTPWVEAYSNPVISKFAGGSDVLDPIAGSKRWSC